MADPGVIQVMRTPEVEGPFREWLASRGLRLFPIPVEDDLPTFVSPRVPPPEIWPS